MILPHFYTPRHPRHWAVLIPLVLAIPLFDLAVVVLRWRKGPFYQGRHESSLIAVRGSLQRARC
jgi:hypothetical protein